MAISKITGESIQDGSIVVADLGITTFNTGTGNTLTLQANSATGLVIDVTGNTAIANSLSFSATGARIRGDFSNATIANRVLFQTSTANSATSLYAIPSGTSTTSQFVAVSNSDPTNASILQLLALSTEAQIRSGITGTGSYLPFTLYTGGSERLRIDTSGNMMLGVTTASSSTKFDVYGNSSAAHIGARVTNAATDGYSTLWLSSNNDGLVRGGSTAAAFTSELAMLTSGSTPLTFYTSNTKRMTVGATGNIGIGTTSPSQLLHVAAGTILASNTSTNSATVAIAGNGSTVGTSAFELIQGGSSEAYVYNRANSFLVLGTNNTERMRISSAGDVMIGTTTVRGKLHSATSTFNPISGNIWATSASFTASGPFGGGLALVDGTAGYGLWCQDTGTTFVIGQGSATGNLTERMRITSDGNLLIGATSQGFASLGYKLGLQSGGSQTFMSIAKSGQTLDTGGMVLGLDSTEAYLWVRENINLAFGTNNTERMRITSSGNVGIGTTSPSAKLDVAGAGQFTSDANGTSTPLKLINNATTGTVVAKLGFQNGGVVKASINAAVYNNDFMTFNVGSDTERMRIDSSGRVNIGGGTYSNNQLFQIAKADGELGISISCQSTNGRQWELISGGSGGAFSGGRFGIYDRSGGNALTHYVGTTGSTAGGTTGIGVGFSHAGIWIDRGWSDNPSITVTSTSGPGNTNQGTLRIHGTNATYASYPGASGSDFSCNLQVDGSITSSDRRKKTQIENINNALNIVKQLQGVSYYLVNSNLQIQEHMSDAGGRKFGFIAQDMQSVIPEATIEHEMQPKENGWCDAFGIDYGSVTAVLLEAVKEQQAIIESLTARIETLEKN